MKSSRKYILAVCALALGFAAPAMVRAEDSTTPPAKKEHGKMMADRLGELKEKLGLTDAQVEQLKKIFADEREQMKALRDKEGDKDSKRPEMQKIHEATRAKIEAILTPEQKAKFVEMRKDHEGKGDKAPKGDK